MAEVNLYIFAQMFLLDYLRFYLEGYYPPSGFLYLTPRVDSVEFTSEYEDKLGTPRAEMKTKLLFIGEDFDALKALEENERCTDQTIKIQYKEGAVWKDFHKYNFAATLADWDVDNCSVGLNITFKSGIDLILDAAPVNVIGASDEIKMKYDYGWIELKTCNVANANIPTTSPTWADGLYASGCINEAEGWVPIKRFFFTSKLLPLLINYSTMWARIFMFEPFDPVFMHPGEWIPVTGGYARKPDVLLEWTPQEPQVTEDYYIAGDERKIEGGSFFWERKMWLDPNSQVLDRRIDNGYYFNETIELLVNNVTGNVTSIKSDFLNINPLGDAPSNEAYTKMAYLLDNGRRLAIWHIGDVARPYVSENVNNTTDATRFYLVRLLQDAATIFNLGFDYDDVTDTLIIEHASFFDTQINTINLFASPVIVGKNKFKFDKSNNPKKESFTWPVANKDFNASITYTGACVNKDLEETVITTEYIVTDIAAIESSGDLLYGAKNIFLTLVTTEGVMYWDDTYHRPNGLLSWPSLWVLHKWGRPLKTGKVFINDSQFTTTFETARKIKLQEAIQTPIPNDEVLKFNLRDKVLTQIGLGDITSATLKIPEHVLELNVRHE